MPDTLSWFWAKQSLFSCLTHYPDSEPSSLCSHAWHIILILSQAVFTLMPDTLFWFWAKQSLLSCHESKDCLAKNQDVSGMRAQNTWLGIRIMCQAWEQRLLDSESGCVRPSSLCSHARHIILILSQAVFALMPDTLSWFWAKQSLFSCLTHYSDSESSSLYSHAWHIMAQNQENVWGVRADCLAKNQDNVSGMRTKTAWLRIGIMCQAWEQRLFGSESG
jgi:hypothetical protein